MKHAAVLAEFIVYLSNVHATLWYFTVPPITTDNRAAMKRFPGLAKTVRAFKEFFKEEFIVLFFQSK